MIFKLEKSRETTKRSSVAVEGITRRMMLEVEEIEVDFSRSNLL